MKRLSFLSELNSHQKMSPCPKLQLPKVAKNKDICVWQAPAPQPAPNEELQLRFSLGSEKPEGLRLIVVLTTFSIRGFTKKDNSHKVPGVLRIVVGTPPVWCGHLTVVCGIWKKTNPEIAFLPLPIHAFKQSLKCRPHWVEVCRARSLVDLRTDLPLSLIQGD